MDDDRLAIYRSSFTSPIAAVQMDAIRQATNGNYVLGGQRFQAEIECMLGRRMAPRKSGQPAKRQGR